MLLLTGVSSTVQALSSTQSVLVVINCTQEKKFGASSCPQEKGNWCSTVFKRRDLVLYCSQV